MTHEFLICGRILMHKRSPENYLPNIHDIRAFENIFEKIFDFPSISRKHIHYIPVLVLLLICMYFRL